MRSSQHCRLVDGDVVERDLEEREEGGKQIKRE